MENTLASKGRRERPVVMEGYKKNAQLGQAMSLRAGGHTGTSGESLLARGHQERQVSGKKQ